jgi:hypothetical protein
MDVSTWRPHGLITKIGGEPLYLAAQVTVGSNGEIIDPKKHETIELFAWLFNKVLFRGDEWLFSSQQPYEISVPKACGRVLEQLTEDRTWKVFCFVEWARPNQRDRLVQGLEDQVFSSCQDLLKANDLTSVFACTLIGASIRCWTVTSEEMVGLWNERNRGSVDYYLDIGLDQNVTQLEMAFSRIKSACTATAPAYVG